MWSQVDRDEVERQELRGRGHDRGAGAEYRRIAERRVRLGLVLQIGEKADIKVSDDEVTQALVERVRQYPGQERQVWEFYQKNPRPSPRSGSPVRGEGRRPSPVSGEGGREHGFQGLFGDDETKEAESASVAGREGRRIREGREGRAGCKRVGLVGRRLVPRIDFTDRAPVGRFQEQ